MRRSFWIFILAVLLLPGTVLAQDGGEDDAPLEGVVFRPLSDIVDDVDSIQPTDFRNDGTAVMPIITTIPVACNVVYGPTEEFGQLTFDMNMTSPTITDHNPVLSGLEPETLYYFRLQGTDDNGIIYLSEVMTFTTPPLDTSESPNLASPSRGATVVGYSSAFGDAAIDARWGAGNAFDDNPNTQWSSGGDGDSAWIEVELAGRARITAIEFWSRSMSDGSSITHQFTITTDSGEVLGPFELPDAEQAYEFEVEIVASTLRFDLIDTSGGNTGVVDIVVYGELLEEGE